MKPGKVKIAAFGVCFLLSGVFYPAPHQRKSATAFYMQALQQMGKQHHGKAIETLKQSIQADPLFPDAYIQLFRAFKNAKKLQDARDFFRHQLAQNPNNPYLHYSLGLVDLDEQHFQKAIEHFQKAIQLAPDFPSAFRALVDGYHRAGQLETAEKELSRFVLRNPKSAAAHYGLAYIHILQKQWHKAEEELNRALRIRTSLLDALLLKTQLFWKTQRYGEMIRTARTGVILSQQRKKPDYECLFLGNIGLAYFYLSQFDSATVYCQRALRIARWQGDQLQEARNLANLGAISRNRREFAKSLNYFRQALILSQKIGNERMEGLCYRNIGTVYYFMYNYEKALRYYKKALPIFIKIKDEPSKSLVLWSLGLVYWNMGDYEKALVHHRRAYRIAQKTGDKWGQERYLGALGLVYWNLGKYTQALEAYQTALALADEIRDREGQSLVVGNLAILYSELGDQRKAVEFYQKALDIARKIGDRSEEGRHLGNLAISYFILGEYEKASSYFHQALRLSKETGEKKSEADFLGNLANLYLRRGDLKTAAVYVNEAIEICRRIRARRSKGHLLLIRGNLFFARKEYARALKDYAAALKIAQQIMAPDIVWKAYTGIAAAYEKQNLFKKSLSYYRKAIAEIERTRSGLNNESNRICFIEDRFEVYERTISLLARLHRLDPVSGFDREAFFYAEKAKARALLDQLAQMQASISRGIDPELKRQERILIRQMQQIQWQLRSGEPEPRRAAELTSRLRELEKAYTNLSSRISLTSARYGRLLGPQPQRLRRIQTALAGTDAGLLEFFLGQKRSFVWFVTGRQIFFQELPPVPVIQKKVNAYRKAISQPVSLSNPFRRHFQPGNQLYQILLGRVLQNAPQIKRLIIVPDGILFFLPFETLIVSHSGEQNTYLIEKYTISYSPSASILRYLLDDPGKRPAGKSLLAFGDPIFPSTVQSNIRASDKTPTQKTYYEQHGFHFARLPFSAKEVREIGRLFGKNRASLFLGKTATESFFISKASGPYRFIHLATHGFINERAPSQSAIVFSTLGNQRDDGYLHIGEILNLRLKAEMVVLSACQTGLGELRKGEGIVGFARAFLYAGARSLVVSLWNINDRSTAQLMKDFYKHLLAGEGKSHALRTAKLHMLQSERKAYRHPFYWGSFVLIGRYD
jgi:CHAT domain-containing protein/Tfp pilus assembly protein PilF